MRWPPGKKISLWQRFKRHRPLLLTLALSCASPAFAAVQAETSTLDDGTRIVVIWGDFAADQDYSEITQTIEVFAPSLIGFNSPGGSVYGAMRLGRIIRSLGISTAQIRSLECASACALAFLGGTSRFAEAGSIGVHQSSFSEGSDMSAAEAVSAVQAVTADVIAYLQEMGADLGLLEVALRYDSTDIRYLSMSEMEEFGVVTTDPEEAGNAPRTSSPPRSSSTEDQPVPTTPPGSTVGEWPMPTPKTGVVRHPLGSVPLMVAANDDAAKIGDLQNGVALTILSVSGRWFRVLAGGTQIGYVRDVGVKVDQYLDVGFDQKFVQIKSFADRDSAIAYVGGSQLPIAAYLASNGWYAIALEQQYRDADAIGVLRDLKGKGLIPEDSFRTYGNTYVRKVCCDREDKPLDLGL